MIPPKLSNKSLVGIADLEAIGYTRFQIPALMRREELRRVSRGVYCWVHAPLSENVSIATVAKRVPKAVICLLTALRYHDIGTQNPYAVWIALPPGVRIPTIENLTVSAVHIGEPYLTIGTTAVELDGVSLTITDPARTVVDCFRFRNVVGLDVALEALSEAHRKRKCTADELVTIAKKCRVYAVMKPYMESIFR